MTVVSDTSPLRALHHLGLNHLLTELLGEVLIPPAVEAELTFPTPRFASVTIQDFANLRVEAPRDRVLIDRLSQELDAGEAEAIALASESESSILLIDERAGRREASRLGVPVTGTLGLLVRAKQAGHIAEIGPLIIELRTTLGFYVSDVLFAQLLRLAGEATSH